MKHVHYMKKTHGPIAFEKQRSKSRLLNEAVHQLNDTRFEAFHNISDYNSKFGKRISQPFPRETRNTDIPGTVKNKNFQKNGVDYDIFIDYNLKSTKPSLTRGMVDFTKQFNHRESISKTNQMPGRNTNNWKGEGNLSDPWDYDHISVFEGQKRLSNFKNHQS